MNPGEKTNPLRTFAICCKIWNHPDVLHKLHTSKDGVASEMDLDLPDFGGPSGIATAATTNSNSKKATTTTNKSQSTLSSSRAVASSSSTTSSGAGMVVVEDQGFNPFGGYEAVRRALNNGSGFDPEWATRFMESYTAGLLQNGAKFSVAFEIISESVRAGDKILLFSQSLLSLNLLEEYLHRMNVPDTSGEKWQKYKSYYR